MPPFLTPYHGEARRPRWALFAGPWLIFLPVAQAVRRLGSQPLLLALALLGFLLFCLVYILVPPLVTRRAPNDPRRYVTPVALFVLTLAMMPLVGQAGLASSAFVISSAIALLPARPAACVVAACVASVVTLCLAVPGWSDGMLDSVFSLLAVTLAVGLFSKLMRTTRELLVAREELARLAVAEERARFARDLHDILGHSLTVITVKAGLAGKLVTRDPARAEAEIADVERLGRAALGDVRATVAGYRQVSLASELASARHVLEAAGIRAELPHAIDAVPGELHELFGWVVREGVTNVVRHSRAEWCTIRVWPDGIEVVDNGSGGRTGLHGGGSGLAGLAERVGAAGGRLTAEAGSHGFRLRVTVPAEPTAEPAVSTGPAGNTAPTPGGNEGAKPVRGAVPAEVRP